MVVACGSSPVACCSNDHSRGPGNMRARIVVIPDERKTVIHKIFTIIVSSTQVTNVFFNCLFLSMRVVLRIVFVRIAIFLVYALRIFTKLKTLVNLKCSFK